MITGAVHGRPAMGARVYSKLRENDLPGRGPNNRLSQTDILGALDRVVLAPPFDRRALVLFYMSGDLQKILDRKSVV